jgi:hypothetical protein
MKQIKLLTLMLVGLIFLSLTSCSSDDDSIQDPRDQYVGNWNAVATGSVTLFQNGESLGTVPYNPAPGIVSISKSGDNFLLIDGKTYLVNGNNLSSNPTPITENSNGIVIIATENSSGVLGSNIININNSITGTWNDFTGDSGNLSGNIVITLTR